MLHKFARGLVLVGVLTGALTGLAGCALFPTTAQDSARKAVGIALTTYADVYQPAVLVYGSLPDCPSVVLCKERAVLNKLKAVDAAATASIVAAQPVLHGDLPDKGELEAAVRAVQAAEIAIASAPGVRLTNR